MGYPQDPWQGRAAVPPPLEPEEAPPVVVRARRGLPAAWVMGVAVAVVLAVGGAGVAAALYLTPDRPGGLAQGGTEVSPGPKPRTTTRPPVRTSAPAESEAAGTLAVPDVSGARLEDAQKTLKDAGFQSLRVEDATGQGRLVLNPDNWVVRSQQPGAGVRVDPHALVTLRVGKVTDDRGEVETRVGTVPDVLCMDLQTAQDTLQSAGFFNLHSKDGTGEGRLQVLDRNWVVTGQSAAVGSVPGLDASITLTVVKFGEPTGDSGCPS